MQCLVVQSCGTLCNPIDCSPPGSYVHGDSPGKNTGVGCHALLQGVFPIPRFQGIKPGSPTLQANSLPSEPPFNIKRHDRGPNKRQSQPPIFFHHFPGLFVFFTHFSLMLHYLWVQYFICGLDDNSNVEWSENRKFTLIAINQITTSWIDKEYNDDLNMVH